jgi:mRNA (guanine-N7-)-methyltransferase
MPYPFHTPANKHDLGTKSALPEENLFEKIGFRNTKGLFEALEIDLAEKIAVLTPVYSYSDAPHPPLSRSLTILGVADSSISFVRKLIADEDDVPNCLHRCTIATKRADGKYAKQIRESDIRNSHTFAKLVRRLHAEGLVAILAPDKYRRFGILKPTGDISTNGEFEAQDFAAAVYVGYIDEVKNFLTGPLPFASNDTVKIESSGLWEPPGTTTDNSEPQTISDGLWVPPEPATTEMWQPPPSNYDESFSSWQPVDSSRTQRQDSVLSSVSQTNSSKDDADQYHRDSGAAAADEFYSGLSRKLETRADSRIYHMRTFNGWVKATQIQELDPKTGKMGKKVGVPLRVLDLACGKGGDLKKWILHPRGVSNYVGIDVARGSLVDAAIRAREMRQQLKRCTFACADLGADVPGRMKSLKYKRMQKLLTWSLHQEPEHTLGNPEFKMISGGGVLLEDKFDVVSIQFAIHYMMQTKKRARRFFQTVSELLEIGGNLIATTIDSRVVLQHLMNLGLDLHFDEPKSPQFHEAIISVGGGACRIRFEPEIVMKIFSALEANPDVDEIGDNLFGLEYTFTLVEGSDHAAGVGDAVNLPEWLIPIPVLKKLGQEAGLEIEYVQNFHEFFALRKDPSTHAFAHTSLYNMNVLNRNGSISKEEYEISRLYAAVKFRKVRESTMKMDEDEVDVDDDDDDDESEEIDPQLKAKFMVMGMTKAKQLAGAEKWALLSSDEKKRLTEIEIRKLASK